MYEFIPHGHHKYTYPDHYVMLCPSRYVGTMHTHASTQHMAVQIRIARLTQPSTMWALITCRQSLSSVHTVINTHGYMFAHTLTMHAPGNACLGCSTHTFPPWLGCASHLDGAQERVSSHLLAHWLWSLPAACCSVPLPRPDLVDLSKLTKSNANYNLQRAFRTAEQHLGLARLLDPEGEPHLVLSESFPTPL